MPYHLASDNQRVCRSAQTLSSHFLSEHCFGYVMTDLEPVFSYQNELVIGIIECMFQFNARRIFLKVLYEAVKETVC